jgi:hypothetical protein
MTRPAISGPAAMKTPTGVGAQVMMKARVKKARSA